MNKRILMISLVILFVGAAFASVNAQEVRIERIDWDGTIQTDKTENIKVRIRNMGNTILRGDSKIYLNLYAYKCPSGSGCQRDELTPFVDLKEDVAPGARYEFYFKIEGPEQHGEYTIRFRVVDENKVISNIVYERIRVTPKP